MIEPLVARGGEPGHHEQALPANAQASALGSAHGKALRAMVRASEMERVRILAWRDLDDPEAGGSEVHAHRIASLWAGAGLDVRLRTSAVDGQPPDTVREGYRVLRRSGRYAVFARAAWEGLRRPARTGEGLVEIWNGMPFFSPVWSRGPRVVFLHHVHAEMWRMVLPAWLARIGEGTERWLAPPAYRSSRIVTLSESSRDEIVELLHLDPERVSVVPPGVDERFSPGGRRAADPLVVAVGRLVPVKRFDVLFRALALVKARHPSLRAVVVGEGYERPRLEALRAEIGATTWVDLPGRVSDTELVAWYRRAWVVASTSLREGWGMTLSEAGACATPAVATDIAGHRDAVVHGVTGFLADDVDGVAAALGRLVEDRALRERFGSAAAARARSLTWEAAACTIFSALAAQVELSGRVDATEPLYRPLRASLLP